MAEIALNVPFDSGEIIHIVAEEMQSRMRGLSPLSGAKEYAAFSVDFQINIRLRRTGETPVEAKETLAWGGVAKGKLGSEPEAVLEVSLADVFDSRDPNEEREERNMPFTVEANDGKGGKIRRKVRVK